jgi:hypothetical protein
VKSPTSAHLLPVVFKTSFSLRIILSQIYYKKGASPKKAAPKRQKSAKGSKKAKAAPKKGAQVGNKAAAARAKQASKPRAESKGAKILELIGRPKGATLAEIQKATGWQAHKRAGLPVDRRQEAPPQDRVNQERSRRSGVSVMWCTT